MNEMKLFGAISCYFFVHFVYEDEIIVDLSVFC